MLVFVVLSLCDLVMFLWWSTLKWNCGRMYSHSKVSVICCSDDITCLYKEVPKQNIYHEEPDKQAEEKQQLMYHYWTGIWDEFPLQWDNWDSPLLHMAWCQPCIMWHQDRDAGTEISRTMATAQHLPLHLILDTLFLRNDFLVFILFK